jgi:hypothetical protein
MNTIDKFLSECVFYSCSALHGVPVKFLGKRFQRFFYADYSVERRQFDTSLKEQGFKGYELDSVEELSPKKVFGMTWKDLAQRHDSTISRIHFEWTDPFVVLCRFKRMDSFGDDHGPEAFEFMFARCEAIAAFISAFSRRNIAPKCLVHIRSGIGFGGNFQDYPKELKRVLLQNKGGLPAFMFYDSMGSSGECGDYLDLVKKYQLVERWGYPDGDHLTLAKLIAPDGK